MLKLEVIITMLNSFESNELRKLGIGDGVEDTCACSRKLCCLLNMFIAMCPSMAFKCSNILSPYKVALLDPS